MMSCYAMLYYIMRDRMNAMQFTWARKEKRREATSIKWSPSRYSMAYSSTRPVTGQRCDQVDVLNGGWLRDACLVIQIVFMMNKADMTKDWILMMWPLNSIVILIWMAKATRMDCLESFWRSSFSIFCKVWFSNLCQSKIEERCDLTWYGAERVRRGWC
jgi:hypothetical protein